MKSLIISIKPYYVFLIIARLMGWNIPQNKEVEVRKDYPKDPTWNKIAHIYCSKNKKSFNRIPKEYQPLMARFLGKVIGSFVCDRIDEYEYCKELPYDKYNLPKSVLKSMCLICHEVDKYGNGKPLYGWYISDLKIYDKPKELSEFYKPCPFNEDCDVLCPYVEAEYHGDEYGHGDVEPIGCNNRIARPPQSWRYCEGS